MCSNNGGGELSLSFPLFLCLSRCFVRLTEIAPEAMPKYFHSEINSVLDPLAKSIILLFSLSQDRGFEQQAVFAGSVKSYNVPALHQDATSFPKPILFPLMSSTISNPLSRIKHQLTRNQLGNHQRLHSIRLQNTSPATLRFPRKLRS